MAARTHSQEIIERSILHELCDYHQGPASCHNPLQSNHVGVIELTHDRRLAQKIQFLLSAVTRLEGLDRDLLFCFATRQTSPATTNFTELTCSMKGLR